MVQCRRTTIAGYVCQPFASIDSTGSLWKFNNRTWEGTRTFEACDTRLVAAGDSRPWCVTALSGRWVDGWDFCTPACESPCARTTKSGTRCLDDWIVDGALVSACTKRDTLFEWCATASSRKWEDGWDWCAPGCLEHARPPPSPPAPPPSPPADCQRLTYSSERCLDSWQFKGQPFSQCTTEFSSSGAPWCKTYEEPNIAGSEDDAFNSAWGWCKPGCAERKSPGCPRSTTYGQPCLPVWTFDNFRHYGCSMEGAGGFEWCMLVDAPLSRASMRQGIDWDYCAAGCAESPFSSASPLPALTPTDQAGQTHPALAAPMISSRPAASTRVWTTCACFALLLLLLFWFYRRRVGTIEQTQLVLPHSLSSSDVKNDADNSVRADLPGGVEFTPMSLSVLPGPGLGPSASFLPSSHGEL